MSTSIKPDPRRSLQLLELERQQSANTLQSSLSARSKNDAGAVVRQHPGKASTDAGRGASYHGHSA
jgi:hypothetical protein